MKVSVLLAFFALISIPAAAQSEKEIISHYKTALKKNLDDKALKSMEITGDFGVQNMKLPMVLYFKAPNDMRVELAFQNMKFLQISNDSLRWEYNPLNDQNAVTRIDTKQGNVWGNDDSNLDFVREDLVKYKELKHTVKLIKKDNVDSLEVYVLEITHADKSKATFYIRTKDYLMYKVADQRGFRCFANYATVKDFVFPRFVYESNPKENLEMHFNTLSFNEPVDDALFIVPESAKQGNARSDDKLNAILAAGDSLYQAEEYDKAIDYYTTALEVNNKSYRAYNARGLCKINKKDYYDAISDLNAAIKLSESPSSAYNNRGLAKYYLGDNAGALKDYTSAIEIDRADPVSWKNRGFAYTADKNYDAAKKDYEEAIKLRNDDGDVHLKLGVVLAELRSYDEALKEYNKALHLDYKTAELYNYKGVSEYRKELYDSASRDFALAIALDKENLQYLKNYATSLYRASHYHDAQAQFENYLKKDRTDADAFNWMALCKYKDEDYKGAVRDFTTAIELDGKNAIYHSNRADAKFELQDFEGAINDYSDAIRIYPNDASFFYRRGITKIHTSKKIEGCSDLGTANEMKYEPAKEAILKNCN